MAMSGPLGSLSQEALIRRQVEAYAADPSAGASKGQSSIQIRRDWKAKEEQLQVGLLVDDHPDQPAMQQCSLQPWTHCRVHVTRVAHTGCRQTSTDGQMLLFHSSSSTATALPACCVCVWLLTPQGFSMQRIWELLTVWSKHMKTNTHVSRGFL